LVLNALTVSKHGPWSYPHHVLAGSHGSRHAGAMQVRFFFLAEGAEMRANCTGKIGMRGIDLGINDRDPDTLAARQPMRLGHRLCLCRSNFLRSASQKRPWEACGKNGNRSSEKSCG
jgi:hypothetical protein